MKRPVCKVKIIDNRKLLKQATHEGMETALEAVGLQAVGHVKDRIRENGSIDTGLMRNSISFAISGEIPQTQEKKHEYKADRVREDDVETSGIGARVRGDEEGLVEKGEYLKQAPRSIAIDLVKLYIGTNVWYAKHVDQGTIIQTAKPFLKPSIVEFRDEYKNILEEYLKKSIKNAKK